MPLVNVPPHLIEEITQDSDYRSSDSENEGFDYPDEEEEEKREPTFSPKVKVDPTVVRFHFPFRSLVRPRPSLQCSICLDEMVKKKRISFCSFKCGNQFHTRCVYQTKQCPLCRSRARQSEVCWFRRLEGIPKSAEAHNVNPEIVAHGFKVTKHWVSPEGQSVAESSSL